MDMEIPTTRSEYWGIMNLRDIPGTFADGIPLAGSSRAPQLLGKPSARAPQRPLQGRRPPFSWWHHHGFNHLRTKGAGTGITPRILHYPLCPRSFRYDVADEGMGVEGTT